MGTWKETFRPFQKVILEHAPSTTKNHHIRFFQFSFLPLIQEIPSIGNSTWYFDYGPVLSKYEARIIPVTSIYACKHVLSSQVIL